jgi:hypothetical protein
MLLYYSLAVGLSALTGLSTAQTYPADIVGTWTTKSNKTVTGSVSSLILFLEDAFI